MAFLPISTWALTFITAATITIVAQVLSRRPRLMKKTKVKRKKAVQTMGEDLEKPTERWETAIFFPSIEQRIFDLSIPSSTTHQNAPESLFKQIAFYFEQAQKSIQICALLVSEFEIANIIQRRRNRGVIVEVITDHDTINEYKSSMNNSCRHFHKIGIPVRTGETQHLMHNKFVIFDREAVLTGSLNFTKMAIRAGNFENVVVTRDFRIVKLYVEEFDSLWKNCIDWKFDRPTSRAV